jgi:DNA-binding NarL/FixJ family response regulator
MEGAVGAALAAVGALDESQHEDVYPDVVLPASEILLSAGPPEAQAFVRSYLEVALYRIVQGTLDEGVRVRWLKGPVGSRFAALLGDPDGSGVAPATDAAEAPDAGDRGLLLLLTEGLTNGEMADRLGTTEAAISTRLAELLTKLGASDRAQATTLAMRGLGANLPAGVGQGLSAH